MTDAAPRTRIVGALLFLLGGWLFLTAWMAYTAGANFHVVEPANLRDSTKVFGALAEGDERRQALRYVASEANRHLFTVYGWAQLVVAVAALALYFPSRVRSKVLLGSLVACLACALAMAFHFNPEIVELGRQIDFMPRDPEPPEVTRFDGLHKAIVWVELLKMALLLLGGHVLGRPRTAG